MGLACPQVGLGAGVGLDALSQAGQMRLIFASFVQARACLDRSKRGPRPIYQFARFDALLLLPTRTAKLKMHKSAGCTAGCTENS